MFIKYKKLHFGTIRQKYYHMKLFQIYNSKFPTVVGNIGIFAKIGLWYTGKNSIKTVYKISNFLHKELTNCLKSNNYFSVIIDVTNDKKFRMRIVKPDEYMNIKVKKVQSFDFKPLKIGDAPFTSVEHIIFIAQKIRQIHPEK
ncbi:hypothetical protein CWI38_0027p0080 [Hamiltosporidium tvaerminnensis]|uniref:Uncharacterized protein n=1 Tax=Hamiltosporidium tvaerminnensis TaxID=1176355 RepID=A0A4Q9M415_9MICR|nr:hypothetical protein CWI38_0027p0080 [Hamiltosporidium tvaerminnensis]